MKQHIQAQPKRHLRTMDDIPLDGRVVLVRVDFNIEVGSDNIVDEKEDYRLRAALPTLHELQQRRCKIVLITHLGEFGENPDLSPIRHRLEDLLKEDIVAAKHLYGDEIKARVTALEPGGILLLPNVRTDTREQTMHEQFGQQLSEIADAYVNEAFSASHRAQTSVALLPRLLPSCAGRRTVQEVAVLEKLHRSPQHPYIAIVSGAKIETKEKLLRSLLKQVDTVCIGGQLGNVFLSAQEKYHAAHHSEADLALARELLAEAGQRIVLPVDVVIGSEDGMDMRTVSADAIQSEDGGLWDVGPKTVENFSNICQKAKTVMWNGPLGRFEVAAYAKGTYSFATALAEHSAYRVLGGGETVMALEQLKLVPKFDHVSVGGGAMVTYLEGGPMPGLTALYG